MAGVCARYDDKLVLINGRVRGGEGMREIFLTTDRDRPHAWRTPAGRGRLFKLKFVMSIVNPIPRTRRSTLQAFISPRVSVPAAILDAPRSPRRRLFFSENPQKKTASLVRDGPDETGSRRVPPSRGDGAPKWLRDGAASTRRFRQSEQS